MKQPLKIEAGREHRQVMGHCSTVTEPVPFGRMHLRPLQFAMVDLFPSHLNDWDSVVQIPSHLREVLVPWYKNEWLSTPVVIKDGSKYFDLHICLSNKLGGLPSLSVLGTWPLQDSRLHINELEMLVVIREVLHWLEMLRNKMILVFSDNSTVIAYIKNQGRTHSRPLCYRSAERLTCKSRKMRDRTSLHYFFLSIRDKKLHHSYYSHGSKNLSPKLTSKNLLSALISKVRGVRTIKYWLGNWLTWLRGLRQPWIS